MKISRCFSALLFVLTACCLRADDTDVPLSSDAQQAVALYQACSKGDLATAKDLVQSGAPLDGRIGKGKYTPLMGAVYKAHLDVTKFLTDYRANLDLADFEGSTALLHACSEDNTDCALALIDAGANPSLGSKWNRTPLMYAADKGDDRIVADLITHKVDLDANSNEGPALIWAASNNKLSTVKLIGDAGANVNLAPEKGPADHYSALGCAASNNNPAMIDYLIGKGADLNGAGGAEGRTPVIAAIDFNHAEALEDLVAHSADVNKATSDGSTPLMIAAIKGRRELVEILANARVNIDATDARGETALTLAGDIGQADVVEVLKNKGAKLTDLHIIAKPAPAQPLSPARAWALAVGQVYTQRASFDPNVLGGKANAENRKTMLKRDWSINNKADLLKELDDLRDNGHHTTYQKAGAAMAQMTDDEFAKAIADHPDNAAKAHALRFSYLKWKDRTGLAWDLCRSANLINAGFAAGYLNEQEAWDRLLPLARSTQAVFASWQEMSDNFLDGREIWAGLRDPNFAAVSQLLLDAKEANSPWNRSAWKTDLSGN